MFSWPEQKHVMQSFVLKTPFSFELHILSQMFFFCLCSFVWTAAGKMERSLRRMNSPSTSSWATAPQQTMSCDSDGSWTDLRVG
jgi:hypothetical protein